MAGEHEWEQADESKKIGAGKQEQANKSGWTGAGKQEWAIESRWMWMKASKCEWRGGATVAAVATVGSPLPCFLYSM